MPPEQVDDRTKAVAQMYFQEKDYKKAAKWTKKWLAKHPGDEDMSVLLAQSQYLLEDYKGAASTMGGVLASDEKAGRTPKENHIQILLSSQFKLDNKDGMVDALRKMVRYYPQPQYWANLTEIYRRKQTSDRVTLGFYRLMSEVGVLKDKGDFVEMSQLAIEAGVPGEAEQTMQKGIETGVLKSDDKTEQGRYQRLLDASKKQSAADRASLPQQAKDAERRRRARPVLAWVRPT